ncbi:MAG: stage II sporulation protein P [Bacilli bacterium]|nr:stage II sporulation protein P [Bacilli bacterium]
MKKRFIARKRNKHLILKIILCIFIVYFSCFTTVKFLFKNKISLTDEKRVNEYLAIASNNMLGEISIIDLMNMNLSSPDTFLKLSFSNFKKLEYNFNKEIIPVSNIVKEPLIYIYNSHQTEDYDPGALKEYNITPTVYMASVMLQKALEKKGIYSVVEEASIKEILNINGWSYSGSYLASRLLLEDIIIDYPSIKYFIDIHRDSVSGTATIDNIVYAKLMFVIGLDNKTYLENEKLVKSLQEYLNNNYREAIKKIYYAKNGKFNQDFNANTILIEIGGQRNKIDEVYNSVNLFAEALVSEIGEQNGN